jgi:hypothetical protein
VNSRHTVTGKIGWAAVAAGAVAGFLFVALFLGRSLRVFDFEWLGLIPLFGGLAAAMLWGHSRGHFSRAKLIAGLSFLAVWTAAAIASH